MKKFICGLLVGLLMATCLVTYARDLIVTPNPFPMLVNGVKQNIDAYNINGSTYLKMAQVGMITGTVVNFNTEKQQIEITTGFLKQTAPAESQIVGRLPAEVEEIKMFNVNGIETYKVISDAKGIYIGVREIAQATKLGLAANGNIIIVFPDKEALERFNPEEEIGRYEAVPYSEAVISPVVSKDTSYYLSLNYFRNANILDYQLEDTTLTVTIH